MPRYLDLFTRELIETEVDSSRLCICSLLTSKEDLNEAFSQDESNFLSIFLKSSLKGGLKSSVRTLSEHSKAFNLSFGVYSTLTLHL